MSEPQSIVKYREEASQMAALLADVVVVDDASYRAAADILVDVKTTMKEIETERKKIAGPIYEAFKATNALFTTVASKYTEAERILKGRLAAYQDECRAKEVRLLEAAASATDHALALVAESAPVADGVSTRTTTEWEVVDPALVPDEFWVIDEKAIAKAVRAKVFVPGIRTFQVTSIAAGTRQ